MLDKYVYWVFGRYRLIVLALLLVAGLLGAKAGDLRISHDLRAFFHADSTHLTPLLELERSFGTEDNLYLLLIPESGDVFTGESFGLIREIGESAADIPYVSGVASILHNPVHAGLLDDGKRPDFEELRIRMLDDPFLARRILAPDGSATAVRIGVVLPAHDAAAARTAIVKSARVLVKGLSQENPSTRILLAGSVPTSEGLGEAVEADIRHVTPVAFAAILLTLLLATRSFAATLAAVLVMSFAVTAAMGLFGWLRIELTPVAGFVPTAIATIAVADSVHLFVGYKSELDRGLRKLEALRSSIRTNAKPVFFTSLTSILGMLTLNFSDSPPFREMGNMIAIGIFVAWCMSMMLWPALMAWMPPPQKRAVLPRGGTMDKLGKWVVARSKVLLISIGALSLLIASQIHNNQLTERWYEYLDRTFEPRAAIDEVAERFGGIHHVFYMIESDRPSGVLSQEYLTDLAAFADWYRQQPGVNHVVSLADAMGPMQQVSEALPSGILPPAIVTSDLAVSKLEVIFRKTDSAGLIAADRRAREWQAENLPKMQIAGPAGLDIVFARINEDNVRNMMKGVVLALALISIMLVFLLRSLSLGLASLVPNLVPIALAYGIWGLADGRISIAVSVVMCISLGLVVDDTVHFLCKYDAARRARRADPGEAVCQALNIAGSAIVISSLVLVVGFASALFSHILPTRETAILLSLTVGCALLADLLLLPPLLVLLDRRRLH